VRDGEACEADAETADAHNGELDSLARGIAAAAVAEGPHAVAPPIAHDREGRRYHFGDDWARENDRGSEDRRAERGERRRVDDDAEAPDDQERQDARDRSRHCA